jgi:hypothetical protein
MLAYTRFTVPDIQYRNTGIGNFNIENTGIGKWSGIAFPMMPPPWQAYHSIDNYIYTLS